MGSSSTTSTVFTVLVCIERCGAANQTRTTNQPSTLLQRTVFGGSLWYAYKGRPRKVTWSRPSGRLITPNEPSMPRIVAGTAVRDLTTSGGHTRAHRPVHRILPPARFSAL